MYSANKISSIVHGTLLGNAANEIIYLSTDSRKIAFPAHTLFFAIKRERRDGHQFISEVYEQGVRCFMISQPVDIDAYTGACFILVTDALMALQQLAAFHRQQFHYPVIGITGSNGKTIVKEWLNQLLQQDYAVVRSPKSYNSQIGVPLSVWQMNATHTLGIFEAGISLPGEMQALQKIIQPGIGILTNIGPAHNEGFKNIEQKLDEKLQLFVDVQVLICCTDDPLIKAAVTQKKLPVFSWGKDEDCDIGITTIVKTAAYTEVELRFQKGKLESSSAVNSHLFRFPFTDDASIENALHCIAVMHYLKFSTDIIVERLQLLQPVQMRLEWKQAIHNCFVLNDSYSNDLASLMIALDYIKQQQRTSNATVILSDFVEAAHSQNEREILYSNVMALLQQHRINRLIAVGEWLPYYAKKSAGTGMQIQSFENTAVLLEKLPELLFNNETILVKGARQFGLERIVAYLEQQSHQTLLEINLTALTHNLQQYRAMLQPGVKMMVMVKAFGYGAGDAEVAKLLQFNKVEYLAVAYADEGVLLRKAGIHLPIMVMNPEPETFTSLEAYNLEPEIFSFEMLESFVKYCEVQGIGQYPVHIKLDTGMHRLGFNSSEIDALATRLANQKLLVVKSVFTHLAASESAAHDDFTQQQATVFTEACTTLRKTLQYDFIKHAANTAAISRHPDKHFDMVRLGIGLYGVDDKALNLQVVSTLKTTVAQVKKVKAGETVGYSRKGLVTRDADIATIRIGYADGFRRSMGNGNGSVWINEQLAPVIGNVCMDMTMVDVTGIPGIKPGDAAEIFGTHIPIETVATRCETIPYEIMTSISQRVKRVYLQE